MEHNRRSPWLAVITLAAVSLGLFACGGGGYSKPTTQPGTMPPPTYPVKGTSGANNSLPSTAAPVTHAVR